MTEEITDRERERAKIAFRVAATLRSSEGRQALVVKNDAGEAPVVVVLRDDSIAFLIDRLHEHGDAGNVVVPTTSDTLAVLAMSVAPSGIDKHRRGEVLDCTPSSEIGMLLDAIETAESRHGVIRVTKSSELFVEETVSELLTTA
jgi:hypothetical protein